MELSVKDRLYLPSFLPARGNFKDFNLKKEILRKIAIPDEERKAIGLHENAEDKRIEWDVEKEKPLAVEFSGRTDRMTYGRQNVMCAMMSDAMPRLLPPNRLTAATNRSIMETPVTISGLTMGKLVMFIMTFFGIRFMRLMPTAAMVPSTVEANAETTAMINVLSSASRI